MNQPEWLRPEWLDEAFALAEQAANAGEVPIGSIVADEHGNVIGRGRNRREEGDPLAHAEMLAIGEAARAVGDWRLERTTLVVTLEPCAMCAGAIVNARIPRLVFAAHDPKAGFCGSLGNLVQDARLNHRVELVAGVEAERSREMLQSFFRSLRRKRDDEKQEG